MRNSLIIPCLAIAALACAAPFAATAQSCTIVGNNTICSDGSSSTRIGSNTITSSGTVCTQIGNNIICN